MTVTVTAAIDAEGVGLYVPFRGTDRSRGPCGTLCYSDIATGDGGGGSIQIIATATSQMFGFHPLLVIRSVNTNDNQAAATDVRVGIESAGNERLNQAWQAVDRKNAQVGVTNVNTFSIEDYPVLIEPSERTAANILTFNWETNTSGKLYNARAFFIVYDLEQLAKRGMWIPPDGFTNQ